MSFYWLLSSVSGLSSPEERLPGIQLHQSDTYSYVLWCDTSFLNDFDVLYDVISL